MGTDRQHQDPTHQDRTATERTATERTPTTSAPTDPAGGSAAPAHSEPTCRAPHPRDPAAPAARSPQPPQARSPEPARAARAEPPPAPEPDPKPEPVAPPVGVGQAEDSLVHHYGRLARLAYLVLPPEGGRHRRVLAAHATVQRSLPIRSGRPQPVPHAGSTEPAYAWVRARVLRAALAAGRRPRGWPRRLPAPAALVPRLPAVWGLRLLPPPGGADELALDRALAGLDAATRAAVVLRHVEGLGDEPARRLLAAAGVADPGAALHAAARLRLPPGVRADQLLLAAEFDPCAVRLRPTDLTRRRQRRFAAWATATVLVAGVVLTGSTGAVPEPFRGGPAGGADGVSAAVLDPGRLTRASPEAWADTARVDFTAWPARGDAVADRALLGRALREWARPAPDVRVTTGAGTSDAGPVEPPRLLYAGTAGEATVVLLHDGRRLARYTEPPDGPAELDVLRVDDAGVTTAAAVVLARDGDRARYLTAPWIAEAATRDLLRPDGPVSAVARDTHGVTEPVPVPTGGERCGSWPVLQLRSSARIVERHAFLLTDLGDATPAHLTHTPHPSAGGPPPRQPREALSEPALTAWSRTACTLDALRGTGVRAVNNWEFAHQRLPDGGGRAVWVCSRADTWRGPGSVRVHFQTPQPRPGRPGRTVAKVRDTAACSRFGQHVLAGTRWQSARGTWYELAAGSRAVTGIRAAGGVRGSSDGPTLALRTDPDAPPAELTGRLRTGAELPGLR